MRETVASVVNNVKKIREKKKELKVAIVSIMPRPRENRAYDKMRTEVNKNLQSQLCFLKAEMVKNKEEGVESFLGMDLVLMQDMPAADVGSTSMQKGMQDLDEESCNG